MYPSSHPLTEFQPCNPSPRNIERYRLPPSPLHNQGRLCNVPFNANNSYNACPQPIVPNVRPYDWKPRPPFSQTPIRSAMISGRKRQFDHDNPEGVKRQCLDFQSRQQRESHVFEAIPSRRRPEQVVAGTSRTSPSGPGYPCRGPRHNPKPCPHPSPPEQVANSPINTSTLQAYARDKLSSQMLEVFEACQQQDCDLNRKEVCRDRLQRDIRSIYPAARLFLTGSSMNGLGCRTSDADLCLVLERSNNCYPDPIIILGKLQCLFRSLSYLERTQLIRAKVPILRFREKGSCLEFDLNVNNTVGIRNTFLLKSYAYADPRVRPMILVIKKWARHHQINDASKGTLSSYTLVLMVLHYLQTLKHPVLPSLQKIYPLCFHEAMEIDEIPEGPKHIPPYNSHNLASLGDLLLGFLKYYATVFRWDDLVISVREAKALPRTNCREWRDKCICVEEPFEKNNVARAVHEKEKFDVIKAQFIESLQILTQRKDLNVILPVRDTINKECRR